MKLVLSWLTDFLELTPEATPEVLADALVQLGHEVDGIERPTTPTFPHVVVGRIAERVQHPNAERLGVCQVDVGEGALRQIVCGAPNARAGISVAVALPGAVLPGDFKIKESKIRDVASLGMICSEKELGLGDNHEGIWELPEAMTAGHAPGTLLQTLMATDEGEIVLDVAVTPNRGDCLSHLGLARDLAAMKLGTLKPLPEILITSSAAVKSVQAAVEHEACLQLNLLPMEGLTPNAPSPALVQRRLKAAGQRPKNALVDVTTYVMLALGQPLHAYDTDALQGSTLTARTARPGEAFAGLTGTDLTLQGTELVIADGAGTVGLAGILGGMGSAVRDATTRVVLEAGVFAAPIVALTGQHHGLHTDAKARFERGTDPAMAPYALRYAAQLLQAWAGGSTGPMVSAGVGAAAPEPIRYHPAFFTKYIGHSVANDRQKTILDALGFEVREIQAGWLLTPPTWRTYMATPEDITEEILRVVGYAEVPHQLPALAPYQPAIENRRTRLDRAARKALAAEGFLEVLTYSFIGAAAAEQFMAPGVQPITLANPLAQTDMTTLRPSLLPGVLQALQKNLAASDPTPRLFEVGQVFVPKGAQSGEAPMVAAVLSAPAQRHWAGTEATPDAFHAKGAAYALLEALGAPVHSGTVKAEAPHWYHPGRSGTLSVGPFTLAHFGELHPGLRAKLDIPASAGPLAVFEVHLAPLLKLSAKREAWQPMPYPPVRRDLSVVVAETIAAEAVLHTVAKQARALPHQTQLKADVFDRYSGKGVAEGHVALGLALTLQSPEKTLTEDEVSAILTPLVAALGAAHGAVLRA